MKNNKAAGRDNITVELLKADMETAVRELEHLMSRLTYASSAWWGLIDAEGRKRLNSVVANATKQGYLPPCQPSFDDICMRIDLKFFRSILSNPHHVLHQLLPPVRQNHHNLRPRAHDRSIPDIKDSVFRKTFIIRMIYHNSY